MAIPHTFDVGGEVETDGPVADSIHGLGVKEVVGPRCKGRSTGSGLTGEQQYFFATKKGPTLVK